MRTLTCLASFTGRLHSSYWRYSIPNVRRPRTRALQEVAHPCSGESNRMNGEVACTIPAYLCIGDVAQHFACFRVAQGGDFRLLFGSRSVG